MPRVLQSARHRATVGHRPGPSTNAHERGLSAPPYFYADRPGTPRSEHARPWACCFLAVNAGARATLRVQGPQESASSVHFGPLACPASHLWSGRGLTRSALLSEAPGRSLHQSYPPQASPGVAPGPSSCERFDGLRSRLGGSENPGRGIGPGAWAHRGGTFLGFPRARVDVLTAFARAGARIQI